MTIVLVIFTLLIVLLNSINNLMPDIAQKNKNFIVFGLFSLFISISLIIALMFFLVEPKGVHTNETVYASFICFCILYFVLFRNTIKKIVSVVLLCLFIYPSFILLFFNQTTAVFPVDDAFTLKVKDGGIMTHGREIAFTESTYFLFDKIIYRQIVSGVFDIKEIIASKKTDSYELRIFHSSENEDNPVIIEIPFYYLNKSQGQ